MGRTRHRNIEWVEQCRRGVTQAGRSLRKARAWAHRDTKIHLESIGCLLVLRHAALHDRHEGVPRRSEVCVSCRWSVERESRLRKKCSWHESAERLRDIRLGVQEA